MNFTEQREELVKRKMELDKGRESIMDLIQHLDQKKDEAIERTFKGIAKQFSTVFAELVPGGKGTLVIEAKSPDEEKEVEEEEQEDEEGDEERAPQKGKRKKEQSPAKKSKAKKRKKVAPKLVTTNYTGVGIKVSFTGGHQRMEQLSGGQQSVVALSLVFAIQRCDPSPFYLFDEIDANLDAVHRAAVARMVQEQSANTQFITTTFRPELLATANKYYGVSFVNKTSRVGVITRKEAQQLMTLNEKEQRERGGA